MQSSVHCNVAVEWLQETGALMFAVEHRYYGCHNSSACPYSLSDPEPLQWLSSRQALADLVTFHAHATAAYKLPSTTKWVSFGGSYPPGNQLRISGYRFTDLDGRPYTAANGTTADPGLSGRKAWSMSANGKLAPFFLPSQTQHVNVIVT